MYCTCRDTDSQKIYIEHNSMNFTGKIQGFSLDTSNFVVPTFEENARTFELREVSPLQTNLDFY